jgi:hypothetical protein
MDKEGQPLQFEMFTGALVDNRTRTQKRFEKQSALPHQMTMFSLKDTVQIGVTARPWLKDLPSSKLELESVDPRTDEEKELDLLREAQELTSTMFAVSEKPTVSENGGEDQTDTPMIVAPEEQTPEALQEIVDAAEPETVADEPETPKLSKEDAHTALVQITKEYAMTIWIDEAYQQRFYNQLPIAILDAQSAGLTATEITTAMHVGDASGRQEKAKAADISHTPTEHTNVVFCAPKPANRLLSRPTRTEGYRVRARRARVRLRTRTRKSGLRI